MKILLISIFSFLSITAIAAQAPKCHLGEDEVDGIPSCGVDVRFDGYSENEKTKEPTGINFCSPWNSDKVKQKISEYHFYSPGVKYKVTEKIRVDVMDCMRGYNASIKKKQSILFFKEPGYTHILALSSALPIENMKYIGQEKMIRTYKVDGKERRRKSSFDYKPMTKKEITKYTKILEEWSKTPHASVLFNRKAPDAKKIESNQNLFKTRWINKKFYEIATFNEFTLIRTMGAGVKGFPWATTMVVFLDSKDRVIRITTPILHQEGSNYNIPDYEFFLYGVKYYVFRNVTLSRSYAEHDMYYKINGKWYYRILENFMEQIGEEFLK